MLVFVVFFLAISSSLAWKAYSSVYVSRVTHIDWSDVILLETLIFAYWNERTKFLENINRRVVFGLIIIILLLSSMITIFSG